MYQAADLNSFLELSESRAVSAGRRLIICPNRKIKSGNAQTNGIFKVPAMILSTEGTWKACLKNILFHFRNDFFTVLSWLLQGGANPPRAKNQPETAIILSEVYPHVSGQRNCM